ncbi:MAG: hypothetical protein JXR97_04780 [Planctomycetes bacterium]|nr:hypothetical protein [Planctomycetota bacterium]
MATNGITSSLIPYTSLDLQNAQLKSNSMATLLSSTGSSNSSISNLTDLISRGTIDMSNISAIGSSLNAVSRAAKMSGVSDAMDNVKMFVEDLQSNGTDSITILQYLNRARELAASDPEAFSEIFSGNSGESATTTEETSADETAAALVGGGDESE